MSIQSLIFCGTPDFALPSLSALAADPHFAIQLVITQPDKPVGRKQALSTPPVKVLAEQLGLPIFQPQNINQEFPFDSQRPDFLVVIAYGQILSQKLLDFPLKAAVNVHASLLPTLRGASPIQHAILSGEQNTGVTIQRMARELDSGPILAKNSTPIHERETAETLHDRLAQMGAALLIDTLSKPLLEIEQDHHMATYCTKFSRSDGMIDPQTMTAQEIDRRVRALVPWPGVTWATTKILAAELTPHPDAMALSCAGGTTLFITQLQPAGKRPMKGKDYERGRR